MCGWVCWQILEELLNVEKCPRKPQYSMASGNGKPFFGLACFIFIINIWRTTLEGLLWDGVDHAWHPPPPPQSVHGTPPPPPQSALMTVSLRRSWSECYERKRQKWRRKKRERERWRLWLWKGAEMGVMRETDRRTDRQKWRRKKREGERETKYCVCFQSCP